jgi:predicted RNA polymerase sigma factor
VTFDVLKLLEQEGYIKDGEDNVVHAEKAFFAARVMNWIRGKVQSDPEFDLTAYLTMLMYYKTDMADLRFSDDGDTILYKMRNNDKEVQELVDSLIKSSSKSASEENSKSPDQAEAQTGDQANAEAPEDS